MNAPHNQRVADAAAVRSELHDGGYRPVALYSFDCRHPWLKPGDPGKRPRGDDWTQRARRDPPDAAVTPPEPDALETGILCDGLRIFDFDLEDFEAVARLRALAVAHFGETLVRWRDNSSRIAMMYRAAEGEPGKRVLPGKLGKIEVLGLGQQLAAIGTHPSGAVLRWTPEAPTTASCDMLPAVTEAQVTAFLAAASAIIGATENETRNATKLGDMPHVPSVHGPSADPLDVAAALAVIPNDGSPDWEFWNKVGMATYAATGGGLAGFAAWVAWSERNPAHDPGLCKERWEHYPKAEPSSIGAGTLFHLAREARPGWVKPTSANKASDASAKHEARGKREEARAEGGEGQEREPPPEAAEHGGPSVDDVVDDFNGRFMVVNEAGKALIYQPGFDPVLKRRRYDRLTFRDLQQLYMNHRVVVGQDDKGRPVSKCAADVWLGHPRRRQYIRGVCFDPTVKGSRDGVLNLWEGFAVEPRPGNWSLLREHVRIVICGADPVRFDYLMGWMARMVQRPAEQGEVAVVMKGGEGTGKGTLAKALLRLTGHHGLAINNSRHLVGNFNGHLRDAVFLFADEALFAGDRAHVGVLKSLITEPYLTVEAKFQNAVQQPNFLHVMMASNEEWVVPAAMDARRFFVLEVSDARRSDHRYFATIWAQMEAGGYEAMLHELLNLDLAAFNVRAVPTTEGLQRQRKLSLGTTEAWWLDCLERGYVFRSRLGLEEYFGIWHEKVTTEVLHASYVEFANGRRERHIFSREHLGRFLVGIGAEGKRWRNGVVGEHILTEQNLHGGQDRKPALVSLERATGYRIGDLDEARAGFISKTGLAVDWPGSDCQEDSGDVAA